MEESLKELAGLVKTVIKIERRELKVSEELVNDAIKYKCKDERIVSQIFDKLLSLSFSPIEDVEPIYCKLLDYVKTYDPEMSKDYAEIFKEYFIGEEDIKARK